MKKHLTYRDIASSLMWKYALPIAITLTSPIVNIADGYAQERQLRTLSVSGEGVEMIETTLADITLGVVVEARTASEAQQAAAQQTDSVVNQLQSQNVDSLETTGINLRPIYNYDLATERITGYTATNTVKFRVEIDRAGMLMDDAIQAGATQITGIQFVAEEEAIATARMEALRLATRDARTQADAVLSELGLSAQDVVAVEVNNASAPPVFRPPVPEAAVTRTAQDVSTPVVGGEQRVRASVTLHISY
ncbi:MAG: SIMPL domain-containing protein [Cyanobacteria bacterium J06633_2]